MKNLFQKVFDINNFSFFLLILPYFIFNWAILYHSYFFSFFNLFQLLTFFLALDIFFKISFEKTNIKKYLSAILFIFSFIFFYGLYVSTFMQEYIKLFSDLIFRGRTVLIIIIFIFIFIFIMFKDIKIYKYFNIFLLNFCLINLIFNFSSVNLNYQYHNILDNDYHQIKPLVTSSKPVILFITDEYHSPEDIFSVTGDSSVFNFSNNLVKNDWIVKNSFYSYETSTIHSLSSLFNFNLSKNQSFSNMKIFDLGPNKLLKPVLLDSLSLKNVLFLNFGIFNIGNIEPLNDLYFFPKNFVELFFFNTIYFKVKENTIDFRINEFKVSYTPVDEQNNFIINSLNDSLNNLSNKRAFIYAHLYMPHSPFFFKSEIKKPLENNFKGYFRYLEFTNRKLEILLSELTKENKYKIILTGDHGYRGDRRFNPKKTFTAFYGFDEKELASIESIQDLGSLINASF